MMTEKELMPESRAEKLAYRIGVLEGMLKILALSGKLESYQREIIAREYEKGLYPDDEKNRKLFSNEIQ